MISFFRKIRQKLLSQDRITRYLTYAVGEIFLVVLGILIALQINTWNDQRINRIKERATLNDLHLEFQKNKQKLDSTITYHKAILEAIQEVMSLMNEPESSLTNQPVDSLIYLSIDYFDYNPSQSVISELISSGKMNLISSDSLRILIFDWVSEIDEKTEGYDTMDEISQTQTLPYLTKKGSMKNIDYNGLGRVNGRSKFGFQNHRLFQDLEFENHMDNQFWAVSNYLLKLERLKEIVEATLERTKP
ncbi:MAG: hypothetical protein HWE09_00795 [Cyclobacteriaceae bacterium]|nr:hypothetical protein [Cyclobacteriaceae bacterium]